MTEGRKDDQGKLPYHLLPPDALEEVVKVLRFGANKYSTTVTIGSTRELEAWLRSRVQNVNQWRDHIVSVCADPAMKKTFDAATRPLLSGNKATGVAGLSETEHGLRSTTLLGEKPKHERDILRKKSLPSVEGSNIGAQSVYTDLRMWHESISITVTSPDGFEVCCVVGATSALECLTMILKRLRELVPTFGQYELRENGDRIEVTISGQRNWEAGMAWHRPFGACMRHLWAWWRKENLDPETGLPHLAHAACCILFLLAYVLRETPGDDRP
jgi:hypothetical protein